VASFRERRCTADSARPRESGERPFVWRRLIPASLYSLKKHFQLRRAGARGRAAGARHAGAKPRRKQRWPCWYRSSGRGARRRCRRSPGRAHGNSSSSS